MKEIAPLYVGIATTSDGKLYAHSHGGDEDEATIIERMKRGYELSPGAGNGRLWKFYVEDGCVKTKNVATWGVA